jgi:hypothetical protein
MQQNRSKRTGAQSSQQPRTSGVPKSGIKPPSSELGAKSTPAAQDDNSQRHH